VLFFVDVMSDKEEITCSFCGRSKSEVNIIIGGLTGHICDNCVDQANAILEDEHGEPKADTPDLDALNLMAPSAMKSHLDEYVIGQDDAKKVLSVAVYNHYKRVLQPDSSDDVEVEKSNIVMVGRTGTGKTLLAKTIAKVLNVPFAIADATVLTEAGYVGEDVESILSRLLQAADFDADAAQRGIIFIDEVDKISRKGDNPSITRDVSGEGVQQAMLKLLEGSVVGVPPQGGRKHPEQKLIQIDTKNILFVCGGAFDGIEKHISKRLNTQSIGYGSIEKSSQLDKENMLQYVTPQDLKQYGLIPELIGRLPVLTYLDPLDKGALRRILVDPKNSLVKQYNKLFDMEGVELIMKEDALDYIVDKAVEFKLGARGLRSICEAIMLDAMYEIPSIPAAERPKQLEIDAAYAGKHFEKSNINRLHVA